jgi:glycosyltransferase involved in cell wall biosynthesis
MILPIVIPARNEEKIIAKTIHSIKNNLKNTDIEPFIVVIDDGSSDNTANIAKNMGTHVIKLKNRGYSALGKPELANTFNAGFEYIDRFLGINSYKYLMVFGADTILEENYIKYLIKEMENNDNLVICGGNPKGYKTNQDAVRGAGRIIRNTFWSEIGRKYPNYFYSWETYPIVYAQAKGYTTKTVYKAVFGDSRNREPLSLVDWKRYGIGMKEKGSILPYVLGRAFKRIFNSKDYYSAYRLILGYLFGKPFKLYDKQLRDFTKQKEWNIIKKSIFK